MSIHLDSIKALHNDFNQTRSNEVKLNSLC